MLWAERKRQQELAARELAGESLWVEAIDRPAMVKIADLWTAVRNAHPYSSSMDTMIRRLMTMSLGIESPSTYPPDLIDVKDVDLALSYVEAVHAAANAPQQHGYERRINEIFNDHRVAFRLVDGQVVPFSSDELHVEAVEPALRLLISEDRFAGASGAYYAALKEITKGEPANAITDAATALQETLEALGLTGNALGPLITDAKKRGFFARHDETLVAGLTKFMDWASADRSTKGDAHKYSDADLDDAWLMVHIVGALIVRLAGSPRSEPSTPN